MSVPPKWAVPPVPTSPAEALGRGDTSLSRTAAGIAVVALDVAHRHHGEANPVPDPARALHGVHVVSLLLVVFSWSRRLPVVSQLGIDAEQPLNHAASWVWTV